MKMRELEQRTGVNRETIRVYLREGLLPQPNRPKANVADYGEEHVRGIEAIRHLQKDQRLPLQRIKRAMDGDSTAMPADATAFPHLDRLIATRVGVDETLVPVRSLLARNPKALADARTLHKTGVVKLRRRGGEECLSRIDAQLLGLWAEMRAAGYTEALGFSPTVCKLHADAAEQLAHAELQIFLAHLSGQSQEGPAAAMAEAALTHMLAFFGLVRLRTVLADLRERGAAGKLRK
jgi:DNA-binding transcriptional MerR regulator